MVVINSYEQYKSYEGKVLGYSDWFKIDQKQIDLFSQATLDDQWIHTDEKRCENESPFKTTIAHGYLTLSLIPFLWKKIADVKNVKMEINYGIENFKFGQVVTVNSEVRLKATVISVKNLRGTIKVDIKADLYLKNCDKTVYSGNVLFLYKF